jgi:hypothetical protein
MEPKSIIHFLLLIVFTGSFARCTSQPKFPATLMEMNKPAYLLKDSLFWNKAESKHFIYYSSKKVGSDFIKSVIENQENNISHIAAIMNIKEIDTLPKIMLWIFYSDYEKYLKTQVRSNAHSLTEYWSAYYNKNNATGAHEIAHIMSQHFWGYLKSKKYSFVLEEGFAFYTDETKFFKFDFYEKAKTILKNDQYKISNIIKENSNDDYELKATVCGAFVKYLVTTFGIEKFALLWKNIENENIFNTTCNKSLPDLETAFYTFLDTKD